MNRGKPNFNLQPARRFVVLGGAGTIGRVVARDLFDSHPRNRVLLADFDQGAARALAKKFGSPRVTAGFADASQPGQLAILMRGHTVVVNCTQHDFNLAVMRAALAARVHYLDLGGLFLWTRRQLKLDPQFKRAGLTAVLGMGCAPGITNVMAGFAAESLERIRSLKIRVAGISPGLTQPKKFSSATRARYWERRRLEFPYSAQTIVEELTLRPWVFVAGRFQQVEPRTGWERAMFGRPVGRQWVVRTRHSEVATLPLSLRAKGLKACDFKVGFDRAFVREIARRLEAGWKIKDFAALPRPTAALDDYEIARVTVDGWAVRAGAPFRKIVVVECHARAKPEWQACAGDVDTGCPASIAAQMIATGEITARGVLPPELAVPWRRLVEELERREFKVVASRDH